MSKTMKYPLPATGVDMMSAETALAPGAVRQAVNVDIDRSGHPKRRVGYIQRAASNTLHSIHYAAQRGWTFVCDGRTASRLDTTTYALTALHDMGSDAPLAYAEYNGNVYFTNRTGAGWLPSNATTARAVGVPALETTPALAASGSGKLLAGSYGVTFSLIDDRGEEGAASPVQTITLPSDGGITITGLPVRIGWGVNIYLTSTDGDILRLAASFPAAFATYHVAEIPTGEVALTVGLVPLPPGEFICWQGGRLFTGADGAVSFSLPGRPHLHNPAHGVIPFSGRLAMLASVSTGIYVGDSRGVWFLAGGDVEQSKIQLVSSHRAFKGSAVMMPPGHFPEKLVPADSPVVAWLTSAGYMVGTPDGRVIELQADRLRLPAGITGRSVFLTRGGRKQVLTTVNSAGTALAGSATDSVI